MTQHNGQEFPFHGTASNKTEYRGRATGDGVEFQRLEGTSWKAVSSSCVPWSVRNNATAFFRRLVAQPSVPLFECSELPSGFDVLVVDGTYNFHCARALETNICIALCRHQHARSGVPYSTPDVGRMQVLVNRPEVREKLGTLRPPENQLQLVTLVSRMAQAGISASRSAAEVSVSSALAEHRLG